MKKIAGLLLFISILLTTFSAHGQRWKLRRYEVNMGLAASHFFADVGKSVSNPNLINNFATFQLVTTRPSVSLGVRYKVAGDMAVRMNFNLGWLYGLDGGNLELREYVMRTTIFEPSAVFEYYLLPEGRSFSSAALFNRRGMVNNYSKTYIYIFGGVGGGLYNAKAKVDDLEVDPRFTPGTGFALLFPAGIGLKYSVDSRWSIGLEYGRRFSLTDKMDGITTETSQRNDVYDFFKVSAIYKVRTDRRGRPILRYGIRRR